MEVIICFYCICLFICLFLFYATTARRSSCITLSLTYYGLALSSEPQTWKFHLVVWQTTSKDCVKKRAARLFFLIWPIKSLICGVVVAVDVVISWTHCCGSAGSVGNWKRENLVWNRLIRGQITNVKRLRSISASSPLSDYITKMTFRPLALHLHFLTRSRRWSFEC